MKRVHGIFAVAALAVLCSLSNADVSQCIVPEYAEFTADDASQDAGFGASIDVDGDLAVVGAPGDNNDGTASGAAYVFQKNGTQWQQVAKLTPNDPTMYQHFGTSVAIDGNTVVVASRLPVPSESSHFAVYVFRNIGGAWQQIARLANSLGSGDETRDMNVAIHGDLVAIGCPYAATRGAVFLFREIGDFWLPIAFPPPLSTEGIFFFGTSIELGDGRLVVGAPYAAADGIQSGAAYVYNQRSNGSWGAPTRLTPDDPTSNAQFGTSVALDGETIVVGATRATSPITTYGAAYVFERVSGPWDQTAKLTAPEELLASEVGTDVSISGDIIAVSASSTGPQTTGAALIFRLESDWNYIGTLTPSDGVEGDDFGHTIALDGTTLVAGAAGGGIDVNHSGSAYAYDLLPFSQDCNANGVPDPCEIATGTSTDCNGNGILDECDIASQVSADCNHDGNPDECYGVESTEVASFTSTDMTPGQEFGWSIETNGDTAVVGALADDEFGTGSGAAYIFRKVGDNWEQVQRLVATDAAQEDHFGRSVAISGTKAIVGADGDDDAGSRSGAAYVFEDSGAGWQQVAKLTASDAAAVQFFGYSVAIHGDTAVVGASGNGEFHNLSGAAYVFRRFDGNWEQVAKIAVNNDNVRGFGHHVSYDGDTLVIGSPFDVISGVRNGSVFVYREIGGTWQPAARLLTEIQSTDNAFGSIVAVDGDIIAASAEVNPLTPTIEQPAVYVFRNVGAQWQRVAILASADDAFSSTFGSSLDISNGTVVVGSATELIGSSGAFNGPVYTYREMDGTWLMYVSLKSEAESASTLLGGSVAIDENRILVGAAWDPPSERRGTAYEFELPIFAAGDLNDDGDVDTDDLGIFVDVMLDYDAEPLHVAEADTNCSGAVDGRDLQTFVNLLLN